MISQGPSIGRTSDLITYNNLKYREHLKNPEGGFMTPHVAMECYDRNKLNSIQFNQKFISLILREEERMKYSCEIKLMGEVVTTPCSTKPICSPGIH